MAEKHQIIVAGGGPAGLTAAIYLKRAGYEVLVIEKDEIGGQISISNRVENYPGVPGTDGETLQETIRRQALDFGADFRHETIRSLSLSDEANVVVTDRNHYECRVLVYALGAVPRRLNFRGESEFAGRGVAYCATCDGELFAGKPIFVVGGGYAAAEEALYLTRYTEQVTMIIREPDFTCAKQLADQVKNHPGIRIEYGTQVVAVEGKETVTGIVLRRDENNSEWTFRGEEGIGVFVFAGYLPCTRLAAGQVVLDEFGYIITDHEGRTNIRSVYGAGDVCVKSLRQLVTAVADGAVAAESVVKDHPLETMEEISGIGHIKSRSRKSSDKNQEKADPVREATDRFKDYFEDSRGKLRELEGHFKERPYCRAFLDQSDYAGELQQFLEELKKELRKIDVEYIKISEKKRDALYPFIAVSSPDRRRSGIYFHGIPGGHEFSSFLTALYLASGAGNSLKTEEMNRLQKIKGPLRLDLGVTLSCNQCPAVVAEAVKLAAFHSQMEVHVINVAIFREFRERNRILSVPFLMLNQNKTAFGKKNMQEILRFLEEGMVEESYVKR